MAEIARELGCDWHTVNKEVTRWGNALLEADTTRIRGSSCRSGEEGVWGSFVLVRVLAIVEAGK